MTSNPDRALIALADRVCAEEPSRELRDAVLIAMGWLFSARPDRVWYHPDGRSEYASSAALDVLTSRDAAAGAMPAGWMLVITTSPGKNCTVDAAWDYGDGPEPDPEDWLTVSATAPDEPRARTAAALRAMAAEINTQEQQP